MDFIDDVRTRSANFAHRVEHLETEEATKSSLVLPFLQMMGYSIFDPTEVVPEFSADVGTKRGEKVDYAIMEAGKPVMLIEAKNYGHNLDQAEISQLFRYFTATEAHLGLLTDGIHYRFFSDLDQPNVMDAKPFFEFNMLDFTDAQVEELKRFTKSTFEIGQIVDAARSLKYTKEIKSVLTQEFGNPSQELVNLIVRRTYDGGATPAIRKQFHSLAPNAFAQFINERINERLTSALVRDDSRSQVDDDPADDADHEVVIIDAEREALYIIKAIVRDIVDVSRLSLRPTNQYCTVLLDNSRSICRLRLRTSYLRIGLIGEEGSQERRYGIDDLDGIYSYADNLRGAVLRLETHQANDVSTPNDEVY